jgi:hypothetical protein
MIGRFVIRLCMRQPITAAVMEGDARSYVHPPSGSRAPSNFCVSGAKGLHCSAFRSPPAGNGH